MSIDSEAVFKAAEFTEITRKLETLYALLRGSEGSALLRARAERLEALQQALCGFPEVLAE